MKRFLICISILALIFCFVASAQAVNIGNWEGSRRSWNQGEFATIKNLMTSSGYTVEADGAMNAANLANDCIFVVGEANSTPSGAELTDLDNWVSGGGILLLMTNSNFTGGVGGNNILSALGSGMSFADGYDFATGPLLGGNFASEGPPYNIVGQNLNVTQGNFVSGGNELFGFGLHYEQHGSGYIYAFGDRYDHNFFAPSASNTNGQLFLNMAAHCSVPEPCSLALLLPLCFFGLVVTKKRV
jgi:hypothetical protein